MAEENRSGPASGLTSSSPLSSVGTLSPEPNVSPPSAPPAETKLSDEPTSSIQDEIIPAVERAATPINDGVAATPTIESPSRKRKSASPILDLEASPQKRPKTADEPTKAVSDGSSSTLTSQPLLLPTAVSVDAAIMASVQTPTILTPATSTTTYTTLTPSSSNPLHISQAPIPTQNLSALSMAPTAPSAPLPPAPSATPAFPLTFFDPRDLPTDDPALKRWLAQQIKDTRDQRHGDDDDLPDGQDSDPETRAERERVRAENRSRKKKWREENSDRNKDNDLRGRVSRRAAKLFGNEASEEKRAWMDAEFHKRKNKREFKSKIKGMGEREGNSVFNLHEIYSDNPTQGAMTGVFAGQEGAADYLRNLVAGETFDQDAWASALAGMADNPEVLEYIAGLMEELDSSGAAATGGGAGTMGVGGTGSDSGAEEGGDGLAEKFDAAFDAITRDMGMGGAVATPALTAPVAALPIIQQTSDAVDANMEVPALTTEATEETPTEQSVGIPLPEMPVPAASLSPLATNILNSLRSGALSLEEIQGVLDGSNLSVVEIEEIEHAILSIMGNGDDVDLEGGTFDEAATTTAEEPAVAGVADISMDDVSGDTIMNTIEGMEIGDGEFPLPLPLPAVDMGDGLPENHEVMADFDALDPEAQEQFLASFADSMVPEEAEALHALPITTEDQSDIQQPLISEETAIVPATTEDEAPVPIGEEQLIELLEAMNVDMSELTVDQLQRITEATQLGEERLVDLLSDILIEQDAGKTTAQVQSDAMETTADPIVVTEPQAQATAEQTDMMMLDAAGQDNYDYDNLEGEEEEDMYEDEEPDLTPEIMRLLSDPNVSRALREGAAWNSYLPPTSGMPPPTTAAVAPVPAVPQIPPPPAYTYSRPPSQPAQRTTYTPKRASTSTIRVADPQHQQQWKQHYQPPYQPYQPRDGVQVVPPGFTGYTRPYPAQQIRPPPAIPQVDLSHLIKPLSWMPKPASSYATNIPKLTTTINGATPPATTTEKGKEPEAKESGNDEAATTTPVAKPKTATMQAWIDVWNKFEIPIPKFLRSGDAGAGLAAVPTAGTGGVSRRSSTVADLEKERNIRALGFPPAITNI